MSNTDHPSPEGLLLPLAEEGREPPLFLVPAAGSSAFSLARLARALGPGNSVYSFTFAGMENGLTPDTSIEEMSSRYIAAIRTIQQAGAYYLGGYCFGGIPAFEMAAQLEAQGELVAVLILIESFPPQHAPPDQRGDHMDGWQDPPLCASQIEEAATSVAERIGRQLSRLPVGLRGKYEECTRRHLQLKNDYRARPIKAPIVQVRSTTYPGGLYEGWAGLTTGGYTERPIPADSDSMLDPSKVALLCKELRAAMDRFH